MQGAYLRKYGVAATIPFDLFEVDGIDLRVDAVHASGDSAIMKDEGAEANTTNSFTDEGSGYSLVLTATEMEAARIVIYLIDQTGTKVWLDHAIVIETYGNASAQHAFDFDSATVDVGAISGDATAADNLEATYDGTGYTDDNAPAKQSQLASLANVGSANNRPASSYTLTTGAQSANLYTDTEPLDGTRHEHTDDAGAMELYYEFLVGSGTPSAVRVTGYLTGNNDSLGIYGWDWVTSAWVQIGTMLGSNSTTDIPESYDVFTSMVGTGADLGKVRIRFYAASGLTSALLAIDQVFVAFSSGVGAYGGFIHVDTNASNTNTVPGVDGLDTNPVSTWAAALTLSAAVGLKRFAFEGGSSITLTGNSDTFQFVGQAYLVALGGQSIDGAYFFGAEVSGTGTNSSIAPIFEDCPVGDVTLPPSIMRRCFIFGTITNSGVGDWFINDPRSRVAGAGSPEFNFGTAIGNTNLNIRGNSGGWQLEAMGDTGTDMASIEGWGQIIEGTCTGGTVVVRGSFTVSGITNLTLSDDARIDVAQINAEADTALSDFFTSSAQLVDDIMDEIITGGAHNTAGSFARVIKDIYEYGTYEGGHVFIDTLNGSAGTTNYENGTNLNPVDGPGDANTIAAALNLSRFAVAPGSSITFTASQNIQVLVGRRWTLALGGQSISGSVILGADVSGVCTGVVLPEFNGCHVGTVTIPPTRLMNCDITGTVTLPVGAVDFHTCSFEDGAVLDYGAAVADTTVICTNASGDLTIENLGQNGADILNIRGHGKIILAASCIGGTIKWDGHFTIENNGTTSDITKDEISENVDTALAEVALMQGATFDTGTDSLEALRNRGDAAWTTGAGGSPPQLLQSTTIATLTTQADFTLTAGSGDDNAYNGAVVVFTDQTTGVQKAVGTVSDYVGSTKQVILAADPGIFTMEVGDTIEIIAALGSAGTAPTVVQIRTEMDDNSTKFAAIIADTAELQSNQGDWATATGFALASVCTSARLEELDAANLPDTLDAVLTDTGTTLPATLAALNDISAAEVNAEVDTALNTAIPATPTAGSMNEVAKNQARSAATMIEGAAAGGSHTTTEMNTDQTFAVVNQIQGRVIIFAADTMTPGLRKLAVDVATSATDGKLTFAAIPVAASDGDTFVVV